MPRTHYNCPECGNPCIRKDGCYKHSEEGKSKRKEAMKRYRQKDEFKEKRNKKEVEKRKQNKEKSKLAFESNSDDEELEKALKVMDNYVEKSKLKSECDKLDGEEYDTSSDNDTLSNSDTNKSVSDKSASDISDNDNIETKSDKPDIDSDLESVNSDLEEIRKNLEEVEVN